MLATDHGIKLSLEDLILSRSGRDFARVPNVRIGSGQSVALVGASGSGKSTALMAIAGIRPPKSGKVTIDGTDPWRLGRSARDRFRGRRIGLVFQSFHLVDALSTQANVWLAAQCAGYPVHDASRLTKLLDRLGLSAIRHRRADHVRHGQAQRIAEARALINNPAVILADEPTSALDDHHTETLLKLLTESAVAERAALLIATHDRRVLSAVDSVVEMEVLP